MLTIMQKLETDIFDALSKVPSFNTCLELKNLGFEFETEKAWHINGCGDVKVIVQDCDEQTYYFQKICPAPDFSELWKQLPKSLYFDNGIISNGTVDRQLITLELVAMQQVHYANKKGFIYSVSVKNENLAQAAAELLLKLRAKNLC